MNKALLASIVGFIVIGIGAFFWWQQSQNSSTNSQPSITINSHRFNIEIADTPQKQIQGLSGRTNLEPDQGMYFPLNGRKASFWMKEMLIDIDIIWIEDGIIVGINHNAPAPNPSTPDKDLPSYPSPVENPDGVLEIATGRAKELDINIGDKVSFENF